MSGVVDPWQGVGVGQGHSRTGTGEGCFGERESLRGAPS
jgi:hypothetical protein